MWAKDMTRLRRTKYGAEKVKIDGYRFDSKAEARRYGELRLLQKAGKIFALTVHPVYPINIRNQHICNVELDFFYHNTETNEDHYEDVKGFDMPLSKLKRKLVEAAYGFKVEVLK